MNDARTPPISDTVGHLAARWAYADKALLRPVFPLLVEGRPVTITRIAEATGAALSDLESALDAARAERDAEGRVVELSGLMLNPTLHRVEVGPVALFSCCALLAQLVPLLLDRAIRLESVDPVSRHIVRLDVTPEEVESVSPETAVGSFVVTQQGEVAGDVADNFCRHVLLFSSSESASVFVEADPRRYVLGIDELHAAARLLYREAWET